MQQLKAKLWELNEKAKAIQAQAQKQLEPIQKEYNELYAELQKKQKEEGSK